MGLAFFTFCAGLLLGLCAEELGVWWRTYQRKRAAEADLDREIRDAITEYGPRVRALHYPENRRQG